MSNGQTGAMITTVQDNTWTWVAIAVAVILFIVVISLLFLVNYKDNANKKLAAVQYPQGNVPILPLYQQTETQTQTFAKDQYGRVFRVS